MFWILLFSFAFGKGKPTPTPTPTRAEQILNQPAKTSLLGAGSLLPKIRSTIETQNSFIRGEFEKPELQQKLTQEIADSIHSLAPLNGPQISKWLKSEGEIWWLYLERLSYDEGTKSSLDYSWKYRRSLFEVVRKKLYENEATFPSDEVLGWMKSLEFRPPVDRLILSEARVLQVDASRLITVVQTNPFRSIRSLREKIPTLRHKPNTAESQASTTWQKLDELWTETNAKDLQEFSIERERLVRLLEAKKASR